MKVNPTASHRRRLSCVTGHFIPKGTLVFSNVWHLNRDREFYGEDAAQFNPARYVDRDARAAPSSADAKDEGHFTYGFGRRTCPGRHVANNLLFIDIAMMLWAVNIERHLDADSTPTPLDLDVCIDDGAIT